MTCRECGSQTFRLDNEFSEWNVHCSNGHILDPELVADTNEVLVLRDVVVELARAGKLLVNAGLPPDLGLERPFWVAARNMRATLDTYREVTGINGEQDRPM